MTRAVGKFHNPGRPAPTTYRAPRIPRRVRLALSITAVVAGSIMLIAAVTMLAIMHGRVS